MLSVEIEIIVRNKFSSKYAEYLIRVTKKALQVLKKDKIQVDIFLLGDREITLLNKKFLGKNKTTSVLSFNSGVNFVYPSNQYKRIGEIYLNPSFIKKLAQKTNETGYKKVIARFLIHGLLHLLGYTHKYTRDTIKMQMVENRLSKTIR